MHVQYKGAGARHQVARDDFCLVDDRFDAVLVQEPQLLGLLVS